ncbi:MAG: hypothetical protein RL255_76, partial [Actinomycetota bacterium]
MNSEWHSLGLFHKASYQESCQDLAMTEKAYFATGCFWG